MSTASNACQAGHSRSAGTALPDLPKLSSGHTCSSQWSDSLQAAFQINQFLEIVEKLKKTMVVDTDKSEKLAEKVKIASASPTSLENTSKSSCPQHGERDLEQYCV